MFAGSNKRWMDRHQYQCLKCHHVSGEKRVRPRYRIMDHFLLQHLSLDQAPYCKICLFRSFKLEDLRRHTTSFPRHKTILKEKGLEESDDFLIKNTNPHTVGPRDVAPVKEKDTLTLALSRWPRLSGGCVRCNSINTQKRHNIITSR